MSIKISRHSLNKDKKFNFPMLCFLIQFPLPGPNPVLSSLLYFRSVFLRATVFLIFTFITFVSVMVHAEDFPTPEEYALKVGKEAKVLKPGELMLDGYRQFCGQRPTVIDNNLDDYGAAYPGFLIFNSKLLEKVPTPVKLWIYAHECGHQFRGPDEQTADCFAVQRGRRQGWLKEEGLKEICDFISPAKGDVMHFSGSYRCEYMRQCFQDLSIR